jgi:tetratricopeptide (TPR) repeat protein
MPTSGATKRRKRRSPPAPKQAQSVRVIPEVKETAVEPSTSFAKFRLAPAILLTLITLSVYFQVIHLPFSNYDDGEYVQNNPDIQRGITTATVRWAVTSTEHANWHPLTWLSHALDWRLFGNNPSGHHFTSLLLHILNVLLLFFFLARMTGSTLRSLFVAALFAVHPINVESVAWIAERKNVLCTLFFLLTLIAYSWYARRPGVVRYLSMTLLFAFALSAKAMVVTLPFVLLLLDVWPLQRIRNWSQPSASFPAPQLPIWKIALEKLPLLVMSFGDSVLTLIAQKKASAIKSVTKFSLSGRLANAVVSYAAYLWKAVWPTRLAVFYPHFAGRVGAWRVLFCALLLMALSAWVWRERARPYLIVGWCWFLGMMVPVIGLIQVGDQAMADRYAYLPLIGIFVALVWGFSDLVQTAGVGIRRSAVVVAVAILLLFSVLASRQVRTWRTAYDLWSQALAVDPNNSIAEDVVGSEILLAAMNKGFAVSSEAQVHFQRALEIDPKDSEALLNIGADLQAHGKLQEAISKYKEALLYVEDQSLKTRILADLGSAYERVPDLVTARKYYLEALSFGPKKDPTAFAGFARTFTDEEIATLTRTLTTKPTAPGYLELGQLQESGGYNQDAIASYRHALLIDPKFEAARSALDRLTNH